MQTKPTLTKEQKKQHILNNIHLLSVPENIAINKTKFTIDKLKERAGKQIDKEMDFERMYDDLPFNNEFETPVVELNK